MSPTATAPATAHPRGRSTSTEPTEPTASAAPPPARGRAPAQDNTPSYLTWGAAWLIGYGAYALGGGPDPLLPLPPWLPAALLATGIAAALAVTGAVTAKASRGQSGPAALSGSLLGAAWVVAFGALFLLITAVSGVSGDAHLQALLWPSGSALVVGLLYLAGGALHRDLLQYGLGTWIALTGTAALFLGETGQNAALALAGGGAYLVAAALEPRRVAALR